MPTSYANQLFHILISLGWGGLTGKLSNVFFTAVSVFNGETFVDGFSGLVCLILMYT